MKTNYLFIYGIIYLLIAGIMLYLYESEVCYFISGFFVSNSLQCFGEWYYSIKLRSE